MGDEVSAVVPVAFFSEENVAMTEEFLKALADEPGLTRILLYLNGGNEWAEAGEQVCLMFSDKRFLSTPAHGWPFYRMWNDGIEWADGIALVLNNDISWPRGELRELAEALRIAPPDVAIIYPKYPGDTRGIAGWAFAARSQLWQPIDERYQTWFGDDELVLNLRKAGYRTQPVDVTVWHYVTATMKHRPDYMSQIMADQALFTEKWGRDEVQVEALK